MKSREVLFTDAEDFRSSSVYLSLRISVVERFIRGAGLADGDQYLKPAYIRVLSFLKAAGLKPND